MVILAIETAVMNRGSAALLDGRRIIEEKYERGNDYRDRLWPAIDRILRKRRISLEKIEAIAVSQGPGSFTGLRLGISVAKSLALSLDKPLIGISTLEILAQGLKGCIKVKPKLIVPVLDAKKELIYTAIFKRSSPVRNNPPAFVADALPNFAAGISNGVKRETDDLVLTIEEICRKIKEPAIFLGEGLKIYQNVIQTKLGNLVCFAPERFSFPLASVLAQLGKERLKSKGGRNFHQLLPVYLRRPEISKQKKKI